MQNRESPYFRSLEVGISEKASQCCQLSRIIKVTPDFGPYLPVSKLESDISQIIAQVAISCSLHFMTIKFQTFFIV